jgi:hypothetical protein
MWIKITDGRTNLWRYLMDSRNGAGNGWIANNETGSDWIGGSILYNTGTRTLPISFINIQTIMANSGQWMNLTLSSKVAFTDDLTLFGRYTNIEGLDCSFGPILIYNRVLTPSEQLTNFNAQAHAYIRSQISSDQLEILKTKEAFAIVRGTNPYNYSRQAASNICAEYGAQQVTYDQIADAHRNGADWCYSTWVSDSNREAAWPSNKDRQYCAFGINTWIPDNKLAGIACYGVKPVTAKSGDTFKPWNEITGQQKRGVTLLGVGMEGFLYTRNGLSGSWVQVPNSGTIKCILQLQNGTFVGIGTDGLLYTRSTLTSGWVQVPNSGVVIWIIQLQDGSFVGIGTDYTLWTRSTLTSGWVQDPNSGSVKSIVQLLDGTFVGVGMDGLLYTRSTLTSGWVQVPNSGTVKAVTQLREGTIVGIGPDNVLYTRSTLTSGWVQVPNSGAVQSVIQYV